MTKYSKPGAGWIVVFCAYFALAGLLFWAQRPPEGETLLAIENSLRQGILPHAVQRQQLFQALEQHPQWSDAWQGQQTRLLGSAWPQRSEALEVLIWRSNQAALKLNISRPEAMVLPEHLQMDVYSASKHEQKQLFVSADGRVEIPATTAMPELLRISLKVPVKLNWELLP